MTAAVTKAAYGYKTMFAYFKEQEAHNVTRDARAQDHCRPVF